MHTQTLTERVAMACVLSEVPFGSVCSHGIIRQSPHAILALIGSFGFHLFEIEMAHLEKFVPQSLEIEFVTRAKNTPCLCTRQCYMEDGLCWKGHFVDDSHRTISFWYATHPHAFLKSVLNAAQISKKSFVVGTASVFFSEKQKKSTNEKNSLRLSYTCHEGWMQAHIPLHEARNRNQPLHRDQP